MYYINTSSPQIFMTLIKGDDDDMGTLKTRTVEEDINVETGEIVRRITNQTDRFPSEPPYIKVYLKDLMYISDLPERYSQVLYALLKRAQWATDEGMIIALPSGIKKYICKELNLKTIRTINNALTDLTKAKIIIRAERGVYKLNPHLFGRGDWQDIEKLRLDVEYDISGYKSFKAAIAYKDRQIKNITQEAEGGQADEQPTE